MDLLTIYGISAVAITAFLTQIFKNYISDRWVPILPLVIGVILVLLASFDIGLEIILKGIVIGGLSMGLYDFIKKPILDK